MSGQTLTVRRILPASREEVFDAWLDAEAMQEWMRPGAVSRCDVTLEPHVGGHFRIVMKTPDAQFMNSGEFRVLERPSRLEFTWISSRWGSQETLVTVELHEHGKDCELVLTHQRFPDGHSILELEGGWNGILQTLSEHLKQR